MKFLELVLCVEVLLLKPIHSSCGTYTLLTSPPNQWQVIMFRENETYSSELASKKLPEFSNRKFSWFLLNWRLLSTSLSIIFLQAHSVAAILAKIADIELPKESSIFVSVGGKQRIKAALHTGRCWPQIDLNHPMVQRIWTLLRDTNALHLCFQCTTAEAGLPSTWNMIVEFKSSTRSANASHLANM